MSNAHTISEERLMQLGEAERILNVARGTIQDYVMGRSVQDVFDEMFIILTTEKWADPVVGPEELEPADILIGPHEPSWKNWA